MNRGRPPRADDTSDDVARLRCTVDEKETWETCASRRGIWSGQKKRGKRSHSSASL